MRRVDRVWRGLPPDQLVDGTAQLTIDAILFCVRERGLAALHETANRARLAECDAAAREQINQRIDRLMAAGRVPEAADA